MKHSIICFISLMMTVFCYARTSIYQLPSDSTDWKVYYMQGEEYHRKGKLQKSLSNYKKALSIHVSDTIVHALANCYYQRGYYQQSIELYNTFIKKDSSETKLNTIAKCYDKLEKPDSALIYRKIIAMQDIENQNNTINTSVNFYR
jgi:tetratricopeptide (TPR) repeat protein